MRDEMVGDVRLMFHLLLGPRLTASARYAAVISGNRPTGVNHHMNWEALTQGEMGSIGLPPVWK
jgi:hypothetical protein